MGDCMLLADKWKDYELLDTSKDNEEKVIEVEDNASTSILLVIGIIGVIIISIWYIRRKRKK